MAAISQGFPPSARHLKEYHSYNQGAYHDWYVAFQRLLQRERPELQIELIPVARILARALTETPLSDIPVTDLYVDDAPHGTPTLYFLAGAITYAGLFDTMPRIETVPPTVHPLVAQNFEAFVQIIASEMPRDTSANVTTAPQNLPTPKGMQLDNPSLAMGLNGIADWSTQHPFIDEMKSARRWVGHLPDQWGGVSYEELVAQDIFDANGWPLRIPDALTKVETYILTEQPEDFQGIAGRYRVTFEGSGELRVTGRARVEKREEKEVWFSYTPGEGLVGIAIRETDPDNHIRNIRVIREDLIALDEVGTMFNPDWIKVVENLRVVRFMDWMDTNASPIQSWDERPRLTDFSYTRRGVPVEIMVALVNHIGADGWFNIPHRANNDYVRQLATYLRDHMDLDQKAYVEYSNEVWNFLFEQAHYAADQAKERWGRKAKDDGWMQYYGVRAAEVFEVAADVYQNDLPERVVRVAATFTDWPGLEQAVLEAPLAKDIRPVDHFDAYAVTGYFGLELGNDDFAPKVLNLIGESRTKAERDGRNQGLKHALLDQYIAEHEFDQVVPQAVRILRENSVKTLIEETLPYQAKVAADNGLDLVMYEGGTHVVGIGGWSANEDLSRFFEILNYSPEMALIYQDILNAWRTSGATLFNAFVDVAKPVPHGSWGHLRHLEDTTARNDVLVTFNQENPAWWETRVKGTFSNGGVISGTDQDDRLQGSPYRDILLGYQGDDEFFPNGPLDRVHGGPGDDHVVLPGQLDTYEFSTDGRSLKAMSRQHQVVMVDVETLSFSADPDLILPVEAFLQ